MLSSRYLVCVVHYLSNHFHSETKQRSHKGDFLVYCHKLVTDYTAVYLIDVFFENTGNKIHCLQLNIRD